MTQTSDISFRVDLPEAKVPKWSARIGTSGGGNINAGGVTYHLNGNTGLWLQRQGDRTAGGVEVGF